MKRLYSVEQRAYWPDRLVHEKNFRPERGIIASHLAGTSHLRGSTIAPLRHVVPID
jgi:hypothetical protein